ncbi:hypothetical protein AHF37_08714 [Paragonimus kellicotti]|nr:hypothetical protein AHF37_08714 [Paragonimus kellicotti]
MSRNINRFIFQFTLTLSIRCPVAQHDVKIKLVTTAHVLLWPDLSSYV